MGKLGKDIHRIIAEMGGDSQSARVNMRILQVRERYKQAIYSVYPEKTAQLHLDHTNSVIITADGDTKKLVVYVDDSLFAAELNAQRELIKLRLLELFNEEIGNFEIKVSRWKKYRDVHPYRDEESSAVQEKVEPIPLTDEEQSYVSEIVDLIEDKKIRKSFEKAMKADLEWKKGEKVEKETKSTK